MSKVKFNPLNKQPLTYEEALKPAMAITDEANAAEYLADYMKHTQKYLDAEPRTDGMTARQICLSNIGYYAGYYDLETQERMQRLFGAAHPIFGSL